MKRFTHILLFLLCATTIWADNTLTAKAPGQVIAGRPFQYSLTFNAATGNVLPTVSFTDFEMLAGPYTSTSQAISYVNGVRTDSYEQTFTYTLVSNKQGNYSIAPASITIAGHKYSSRAVQIQVLPPDQQSSSSESSSSTASSSEIFVRPVLSKTTVYEQEPVLLTYRLYFANVDIVQLTNNITIPTFDGFLKEDMNNTQDDSPTLEHYNGRNYQVVDLYRILLYPQRPGELHIDPAQFEAVLRVQTQSHVRSIWDDFYGNYTNVLKPLPTRAIDLTVNPLPTPKPDGFIGAVGQYSSFQAQLSNDSPRKGEAITLSMTIQGTGNLKALLSPAVRWPEAVGTPTYQLVDNIKTTTSGYSGSRTFRYDIIPTAEGEYPIDPIRFVYFNPKDKQYHTLTSAPYTLQIGRANTSSTATTSTLGTVVKEDIRQLGNDIRFIDTRERAYGLPTRLQLQVATWHTSTIVFLYLIPLMLSALILIIFHRRIRENADLTRVRYKRAGNVAQKRLRRAKSLLKTDDKALFYEEIERAAWSYLSDRLSIPTAELGKDNISDILRQKQVDEQLIKETVDVLSTAEFARYAPSTDQDRQNLYQRTTAIINQLEDQKL